MKLVFLGDFTENKKFFILSIARLLSCKGPVIVFTKKPYLYDSDESDTYELHNVLIRQYRDQSGIRELIEADTSEYMLIDLSEPIYLGDDIKMITVCEPERGIFEKTIHLIREYNLLYEYTDMLVVYMNLLEYCSINRPYLEKLFERFLRGSVNVTKAFEIFYEDRNECVFQESMYTGRFRFKNLSHSYKKQLLRISESITGLSLKELGIILKKAERLK